MTDPVTIHNGIAAYVFKRIEPGTATLGGMSGGAIGAIMPVRGMLKMCIFSTACTYSIPLVLTQPTTVNGVPGAGTNGVGIGGLITAGAKEGEAYIRVSLQGAPWTVKSATVLDRITIPWTSAHTTITWTATGWVHAPVSTTTSTAQPSGAVQLVTPNQVVTNLPLGSSQKMGSFVIVVYHFIPEPSLVLLLGSGVAGLVLLGRKRMRR